MKIKRMLTKEEAKRKKLHKTLDCIEAICHGFALVLWMAGMAAIMMGFCVYLAKEDVFFNQIMIKGIICAASGTLLGFM